MSTAQLNIRPNEQEVFRKNSFIYAYTVFMFIGLLLILCGISFIINSHLDTWQAILAFTGAIAYAILNRNITVVVYFLSVSIIAIILCGITFDTSYDSIHYHKITVELLSNNWNPIYDPTPNTNLWVLHYARAQELMAASLTSAGLTLEMSKSINLIFFSGVYAILYCTISSLFIGLNRKNALIITTAFMLNPVVIAQLFTFYNDAYLYLETIAMISLAMLLFRYGNMKLWLALFFLTILSVNTKFTHFFFAGLFWLFFYIGTIAYKKWELMRKILVWGSVSFLFGVVLVGYNPYITNIAATGDPFYPLLSGADIMTSNTPSILIENNRFVAFIKAQLSTPNNSWGLLKLNINKDVLLSPSVDSRILGFGPFFVLIFLASILLMLKSKANAKWWLALTIILIPISFFTQSWWARYIPYPWCTAGIALLASYRNKNIITDKTMKILRSTTFILILFSATIAFCRNFGWRLLCFLSLHHYCSP